MKQQKIIKMKKIATATREFEGSCAGVNNSLSQTRKKINDSKVLYELPTRNSNSVAYTLLKHAGLSPDSFRSDLGKGLKLYQVTVGWGTDLLNLKSWFPPDTKGLCPTC